jgi:serine/threonine protein kinase
MRKLDPVPGDIIGDYEILERIGGHMGLVYRARHRLLDKVVALKLLPAEAMADPKLRRRFETEIHAIGSLEHPNLVTATDAREVNSWYLLAMEWIDGATLEALPKAWQLLTRGLLPVEMACEAARQAALGLQCLREHGLTHRDIKPSNLMVTHEGTLKVIDLGLARIREDTRLESGSTGEERTEPGTVLGTFHYTAPEQFLGSSGVDFRADIYSLGCTLYHLLTGKPPYWQRKEPRELMQAHLNDPFPSLAKARPDAPAGLEAVLERMTAKDPDSRFATPAAVAEALEPFAQGTDLKRLFPAETLQEPGLQGTPNAPPGPRPPPRPPFTPKAPWLRRAALFGVMLAIAGAAILVEKSWSPPPPPEPPTNRVPVVVLMDVQVRNAVYPPMRDVPGGHNAAYVARLLKEADLLPPDSTLAPEPLYAGWDREKDVLGLHPDLVIVHRSAFFHAYNAKFDFGATNEFDHPTDDPRWRNLYDLGDDKLITVMGLIGCAAPRCRFLVYSRGTGTNWLDALSRSNWVNKVEARFPKLKGRLQAMLITRGQEGSFDHPETKAELFRRVGEMLHLPQKGGSEIAKPVVLLMHTREKIGTYPSWDGRPGTNTAGELATLLKPFLPPKSRLIPEPTSVNWDRDAEVVRQRPNLVLALRSAFYHRSDDGGAYPPADGDLRVATADERLSSLMDRIGHEVPECKFLIYSRGIEPNWLDKGRRSDWVRRIEDRFPHLKDRITTIAIHGGPAGSFTQPENFDLLLNEVKNLLNLPAESQPEKSGQPSTL